jgi:meiotically up-regulated gene 157 (Mug157) protein
VNTGIQISESNPFFFKRKAEEGIGGTHAGFGKTLSA